MKKILAALLLIVVLGLIFALSCQCGHKFTDYLGKEVQGVLTAEPAFSGIEYRLDGQNVYLKGHIKDNTQLDDLISKIKAIPGIESITSQIESAEDHAQTEPAALQEIHFILDKTGHQITLQGVLASQEEMDAVLARLADYDVVNELTIARLPDYWQGKATPLIEIAKKFERLKMQIQDTNIAFKGDISSEQRADIIEFELRQLFPKAHIKSDIALAGLDAATRNCQSDLKQFLDANVIQFASGSAQIDATAQTVVDMLIDIAKPCANAKLTIIGHTDSTGSDEVNQKLSLARAQSVLDALQAAGIDAANLQALGYGSTRPIASNDSAAGRQLNRRIEIWLN